MLSGAVQPKVSFLKIPARGRFPLRGSKNPKYPSLRDSKSRAAIKEHHPPYSACCPSRTPKFRAPKPSHSPPHSAWCPSRTPKFSGLIFLFALRAWKSVALAVALLIANQHSVLLSTNAYDEIYPHGHLYAACACTHGKRRGE